jgi:hypothetical protein
MKRFVILLASSVCASISPSVAGAATSPDDVDLDVVHWQVVRSESGPVNYYEVASEGGAPFVRSHYRPPAATTVLGFEMHGRDRQTARTLRWRWRAQVLPAGGDECTGGKEDSAADVYLMWKKGFRWFTLKYVWSTTGRVGAVCARKRNLFVAQDATVLESGGPTGVWKDEVIDLKGEFRRHFDGGDPKGSVPDFVGVGIMTDGDQTRSDSAADYADFILTR